MGQQRHSILSARALCLCAGVALAGADAPGQDSVSTTPGSSDALSAYAQQEVRYVVDAATVLSSWGNAFLVAPVLKASADPSPLFSTQTIASKGISPLTRGTQSFPSRSFAFWESAGAGVNPAENSAAGSVSITSWTRSFSVGLSDAGLEATNVVGAVIGQRTEDASRLYVTRRVIASSRASALDPDTSTVSLGSVDATGDTHIRVDRPQTDTGGGAQSVQGDSIAHITGAARSSVVNTFSWTGSTNVAGDGGATTFLRNGAGVSTNPPVSMASALAGGTSRTLALDFAGAFLADGQSSTTAHLDPGVFNQRGNPSYAAQTLFQGATGGSVASLATSNSSGQERADSLNIFGLSPSGGVVDTLSATLPATIGDGGDFTATDPRFVNWGSQVPFRGGNGPVAMARMPDGSIVLAATAMGDDTDKFIAVAHLATAQATPTWTVAAHPGQRVLDGPDGQPRGTLTAASPAGISSPGVDSLGNVYFVATFQPTLGGPSVGVFKSVKRPDGSYQLERLLSSGQIVTGRNSTREYEIVALTLADGNSIASGGFFSGSLLPGRVRGDVTDPADPLSFGGLVAAALLRYDNLGSPEEYEALLYVGPTDIESIPGDLTGDGQIGPDDLALMLGAWGSGPSIADLDNNGMVGPSDLALLLSQWTS